MVSNIQSCPEIRGKISHEPFSAYGIRYTYGNSPGTYLHIRLQYEDFCPLSDPGMSYQNDDGDDEYTKSVVSRVRTLNMPFFMRIVGPLYRFPN